MADITNLSQFLSDVANAIRTKKETTEQIPAENFDQEILSIETGIDTSDATATANDIISSKTAYVNGEKITGTIPNNGELNITPSTETQSIPEGYTSGGIVRAVDNFIDENIVAENIKSGVTILGITGTLTQGEDLQEQLNAQDTVIQQLQEELSNKAIYDCNYYNARLVPTNGQIISYITEISTQLDTSSVTDMTSMFSGCTNLTTIPQLNTSNVTNMNDMFSNCSKLTTIPLLDTSSVTNMGSMFLRMYKFNRNTTIKHKQCY